MKRVNSALAYAYIRKRILNHEYHPGRPLMTKDLAADIGVSRTPVRDALRQLEAEGLVIRHARSRQTGTIQIRSKRSVSSDAIL